VPAATVQERIGEVSSIAHESFDGVLAVKTLASRTEIERLRTASERLRDVRLDVGRLRATFEPSIDALPELGMIGLLAIGSWLVSRDVLSVGELVQATALFTMLAVPMRIVGFFRRRCRGRSSPVIASTPCSPTAPARRSMSRSARSRRAHCPSMRTTCRAYGDIDVLTGVDLQASAGESVAIVGSTGPGRARSCSRCPGSCRRLAVVCASAVSSCGESTRGATGALAVVFQETACSPRRCARTSRSVATSTTTSSATSPTSFVPPPSSMPCGGFDTVIGERGVAQWPAPGIALARALATPRCCCSTARPRRSIRPSSSRSCQPAATVDMTLLVVPTAWPPSVLRIAVFLDGGRVVATGTRRALLRDDYASLVRLRARGSAGRR
jgi:hypothetical protein